MNSEKNSADSEPVEIDIFNLNNELDRLAQDAPTRDLTCEPFGTLEIEYTGEFNELTAEESALLGWIESNWLTIWPGIRDTLAATISAYNYGQTLDQLIINSPHCLGIDLKPGSHELDPDWSVDLVIPLPSGHHAFFVGMRKGVTVSSSGEF